MCGNNKPKTDTKAVERQQDAAAEARAREEARQMQINDGQSFLDAMFDGGDVSTFSRQATVYQGRKSLGNPEKVWKVARAGGERTDHTFGGYQPYLDERRQTLTDFYIPQLDDKYSKAQDQLKYGLARSGQSVGSEAVKRAGELSNTFDLQRNNILTNVDADINQTRQQFETTRGALEDMLMSTGDAARVADRATTTMTQLYNQTPKTNPLGDVFANTVSGFNAYGGGVQQGRIAGIYDSPSITTQASNAPSGRMVR